MKPALPLQHRYGARLLLLMLLLYTSRLPARAQGCTPVSTLSCSQVQVNMPWSLSFDGGVAGTLPDASGLGTGFTMADTYSGTRLAQDGTPAIPSVPGYQASRLLLSGGRLQVQTLAGIAFRTNNNQVNTLGVSVNSQRRLQLETAIVNPANTTTGVQGGLWLGLSDKTFVKLVVTGNRVELRREINDVTSSLTGTANPDQRITPVISGLQAATVRLRLVVDPSAQTVSGYFATDGVNYTNVGAGYGETALSISGMGLTATRAYAGIFATHRNNATPVTYSFEYFDVRSLNAAPVFPGSITFNVQDNLAVGASLGTVSATDADGDPLQYRITGGNTNGAFAINSSTGALTLAKVLNFHAQSSYQLQVHASDPSGGIANATVQVNVALAQGPAAFPTISWSTVAALPLGTTEAHGVAVNGKLYLFGGYDALKRPGFAPTKRSYVYDPALNRWDSIAPLPYTPNGSNFGGVTHCGMTTDGTDVYMVGGYRSNSTGTGQVFGSRQAYRYHVATNTYSALPQLPAELASGQLSYVKGRLHYIGGLNMRRVDTAIHLVLNLDNLSAGWQNLPPPPVTRNHAGSAVYAGQIYFIGGAIGQNSSSIVQRYLDRYDPATNQWTRLADMPSGRDHISSSVVVLGDRIIVVGGQRAHNVHSQMVLAYEPATNTWTNFTSMPNARSAGVAAVLGAAIHHVSGNFTSTNFRGVAAAAGARSRPVADAAIMEEESENKGLGVLVFPNPASPDRIQVNVQLVGAGNEAEIGVYDMSGGLWARQKVKANADGILTVALSPARPLAPGLYVVRVATANGQGYAKVLVR